MSSSPNLSIVVQQQPFIFKCPLWNDWYYFLAGFLLEKCRQRCQSFKLGGWILPGKPLQVLCNFTINILLLEGRALLLFPSPFCLPIDMLTYLFTQKLCTFFLFYLSIRIPKTVRFFYSVELSFGPKLGILFLFLFWLVLSEKVEKTLC